MTYATPDAGSLSARVAAAMPDSEPLNQHVDRGLDHGAWVPLKIMYPYADVPVLQMSMPTHDPARLLEIGGRIRSLREEGVVVIGSGYMTHGLPNLTREMFTGNIVPTWSSDFDSWAADALSRGDIDELAAYRSKAPGLPYAHPTVEHYTPLFITLGAATEADKPVETTIEGFGLGIGTEIVVERHVLVEEHHHVFDRAGGGGGTVWRDHLAWACAEDVLTAARTRPSAAALAMLLTARVRSRGLRDDTVDSFRSDGGGTFPRRMGAESALHCWRSDAGPPRRTAPARSVTSR